MSPYKGLAARVVKVTFHEEIEEVGSITADRTELGVAALEYFVAQRSTHVCPPVKECTRELEEA